MENGNTKLTRLTLYGFKSFKRKISIPFSEGFVTICGPNGVGKSNILDAICFGLGRSSMKSLRAGRLNELIYHGNGQNPAADYASVTLWFDNSSKIFPFDTEEVAIARKVNKQGMSLFKINGKTTTREKILEMLSSARIHPDGFNIILQGDVTNVIEMSPEERRGVIDEVAGIAQYNDKKERALANLDKVAQKLREVEIVISDRMERLQQLEADRNAALKYKDLQQRLELLKASLSYKKFSLLDKEFQKLNAEATGSENEMVKLEDEIRQTETEMEESEKRKEKIAETMFVRSRESSIRQEIEDLKSKALRDESRVESDLREIERLDNLIAKLESLDKRGGFSRGVQAVLDLKRKGVHGVVSSLIRVPKEYETSVEVAGGLKLENVVVDDTVVATECINYLKQNRIGRATFLPLNKIKPKRLNQDNKSLLKKPGVVGLATDLIKYDSRYAPAIEHVFGGTVVVENLGVARDIGIGKVRMVTLDGDLVETSGAMIGGYYQKRELLSSQSEIQEYLHMKKELDEEINFLRIEVAQLNKKMDEMKLSEEKEAKSVSDLYKERDEIDKRMEELRQGRKEKFEQRLVLQTKINRLKIKAAKMDAQLENYKIEVEKLGDVEFVDERPEILDLQIGDAIRELNALGLVNLKAIEEYEAFKVEFDELKNKYDIINSEKLAIEEMILKIEEKRKEVFYETLNGINQNFRRVFKELAVGDASLELEDPMNIESGLLIQASPSGKNMLNIDATSGGEKSLIALAFLFGVQLYKPAPFYILDEVDAALDKVNTKKVIDLVKKLAKTDQFIVITHNDYTIKHGDKIYGVTMEGGESKILGLELPTGEQMGVD